MEDIEKVVKENLKTGYEYEIFFQRIRKTKIDVSEGEVENLSRSEESGVGIRVLKGKKLGFAHTSALDRESLKDTLVKAMEICDLQSEDEGNTFLRELHKSDVESVYDQEGLRLSLEEKIKIPIDLEEKAKSLDDRIKGVRKSSLTEGESEVFMINSYGVQVEEKGTFYTAMIATLAQEEGDSAISWEFRGVRKLSRIDVEDIARDVVMKSVSLLNPKPMDTKVMSVIFFRESAAMLLEAFSQMFLGDSLVKGKTLLKGKEGESVGSELLTIIDNGTLKEGFATSPYDGEGVPRKENVVIEGGVFKNFLHSLYTAKLSSQKPTGNSERSSFRSQPQAGTTNLYIKPAEGTLEDLIGMEEEVLLVTDLMGLHTVDPVSGEFSLGASGVLYKGGKRVHAVRGVTVAGNVLDLWNKIFAVGNDLKFYGSVGSPSLLVKDITVGGN